MTTVWVLQCLPTKQILRWWSVGGRGGEVNIVLWPWSCHACWVSLWKRADLQMLWPRKSCTTNKPWTSTINTNFEQQSWTLSPIFNPTVQQQSKSEGFAAKKNSTWTRGHWNYHLVVATPCKADHPKTNKSIKPCTQASQQILWAWQSWMP